METLAWLQRMDLMKSVYSNPSVWSYSPTPKPVVSTSNSMRPPLQNAVRQSSLTELLPPGIDPAFFINLIRDVVRNEVVRSKQGMQFTTLTLRLSH